MSKESIYDAEINPLMAKIIEICKREKIAMIANFSIPNDDDPNLVCTTALLEDSYSPTKDQLSALQILRDGFIAFAISRKGTTP